MIAILPEMARQKDGKTSLGASEPRSLRLA